MFGFFGCAGAGAGVFAGACRAGGIDGIGDGDMDGEGMGDGAGMGDGLGRVAAGGVARATCLTGDEARFGAPIFAMSAYGFAPDGAVDWGAEASATAEP